MQPEDKNAPKELPSLDEAIAHARLPSIVRSLPDRDVVVVGTESISAGLDARKLSLGELKAPTRDRRTGGCDRLVCRTVTGNVYEVKRTPEGAFVVSDARSKMERVLEDTVARSLTVVVGERFVIPKRHTGHITHILAVDSSRAVPAPNQLRELCTVASQNFGGGFSFEGTLPGTSGALPIPSKINAHRKPLVLVNGRGLALGMERVSFELKNLKPFVISSKDAWEALFRTSSGNIYGLIRTRKGSLLLLNSRYGKETQVLTEGLATSKVVLGERFALSGNSQTSPISQIITVHKAKHIPEGLTIETVRRHALASAYGNVSTIRNELMQACCERLGQRYVTQILKSL